LTPGPSPRRADPLDEIAERLGHHFGDPNLLRQALTHRSMISGAKRQRRPGDGYERLEFLGDRVLALVVADMIYRAYPAEDEGALAKRFAVLVSRDTLAQVARDIDLGHFVILSRGEEESGGRGNANLLADSCEAAIGALYLDGGVEPAAAFIRRHWSPMIGAGGLPPRDAKTALQEWAQGARLPLPVYRVARAEGPPHDPLFEVEVSVAEHPPVVGKGRSKRAAETAAAAVMLSRLKTDSD
jgi:ribonuclease-3